MRHLPALVGVIIEAGRLLAAHNGHVKQFFTVSPN
jgi:hypothetical protein